MTETTEVVVIGAGLAGLAVVACLRAGVAKIPVIDFGTVRKILAGAIKIPCAASLPVRAPRKRYGGGPQTCASFGSDCLSPAF
jgi:threonine dehydrogenase-like Zn-dependent dehydrogenase